MWCGGKTRREWTWVVFKRRYSDMKESSGIGYGYKNKEAKDCRHGNSDLVHDELRLPVQQHFVKSL